MRSARGAGRCSSAGPAYGRSGRAGSGSVQCVSRRRSITVHSDDAVAQEVRRRCAEEADRLGEVGLCPGLTVGELLTVWLDADHGWRPSIVSGYCSIVRFLARDGIAGRRAVEASPLVVLVHEYLGSAC